jgi:ankyrin repeat protein
MLLGIEDMYHQQALTLLQWLAYARSPPTLGELVEAAVIDSVEESSIDVENRGSFEDTLNILSGLVATQESQAPDDQSGSESKSSVSDVSSMASDHTDITHHRQSLSPQTKVRLAHFSVKEYLESKRMVKSDASYFCLEHAIGHRTLAQSCLTYLRHYNANSDKTSTKQDLETFPLLEYAAQSWYYHATFQCDGKVNCEVSFLQSDAARKDWLLVHDPDTPWRKPFEESVNNTTSAVYYTSLIGLRTTVEDLLDMGGDVNAEGGHYGYALHAASKGGHTEVVQLLLDRGADVNAEGGDYGYALQAASVGGHTEVVQLLLDRGADVNAEGGDYGYALHTASVGGHTEVVQLLLDRGADVNAEGGLFGHALQAASARGDTGVVQMLLDRGADVNAEGGYYGYALHTASDEGHTEVVQLLLDRGADVNAEGVHYGYALQAASKGGHIGVVQMLLDRGADVNAEGGHYGYALHAASARGHMGLVQLLQAAGARDSTVGNIR